ncbi:MAG: PaaI family thioesterase [Kiritimatiellae bacterium]|nr:PaaI family thioesterase [Kiritimatiellia bacterium]
MSGNSLPLQVWLPRTRGCYVCGIENSAGFRLRLRREGDVVVAEYDAPAVANGYRGMVHGGIAMTLLDEAMTWAAILATRSVCVAAEMSTRFRHPMPVDARYRIEGRVLQADRRLVLTQGHVLDAGGRQLVTASGKYVPRRDAAGTEKEIEFADPVPPELGLGPARHR